MNRAECKAACRLHLIILNRRNIGTKKKKVGVGSARSKISCIKTAVRQVVFTDVQITIQQRAAVLQVFRAVLLLARTKQMLPLIGCL